MEELSTLLIVSLKEPRRTKKYSAAGTITKDAGAQGSKVWSCNFFQEPQDHAGDVLTLREAPTIANEASAEISRAVTRSPGMVLHAVEIVTEIPEMKKEAPKGDGRPQVGIGRKYICLRY